MTEKKKPKRKITHIGRGVFYRMDEAGNVNLTPDDLSEPSFTLDRDQANELFKAMARDNSPDVDTEAV